MGKPIRDLEHRFDIGGRVYVAQVCSPAPHTAAPISSGRADVMIVTCATDELSEFNNDDPAFLARRVVVDISTRMPQVPETELATLHKEVVDWIGEHRRDDPETTQCLVVAARDSGSGSRPRTGLFPNDAPKIPELEVRDFVHDKPADAIKEFWLATIC